MIEAANAAAGGVSAAANFVRPGNAVSGWIDKNIIQAGEDSQSDVTRAAKQQFRQQVDGAGGVAEELAAVGRYVVENPGPSAAQAVGSFAGPALAVKGGRTLASIAGLNAARGGLAGGAAAGAAMAGGDAAGTAYDLATKAGATDEQGLAAGRGASVLPAVIGGVGGFVGAERLVAGAKGFAGNAVSRALKTGAVEGAQEAIEEGVTQYEGQRAAMPYDKTIDPTKGVAAAAGMGAALGGATGAGVSLLTGGHAPEGAPMRQGMPEEAAEAPGASAPAQPAIPAIDPNAGPLSKAASMAGDLALTPVPSAPSAQEQRAKLDATIGRLPEAQQREARVELADADNDVLPPGVRAMRSARLQELVDGAPAETVDLTPNDMERGRVLQNFDARAGVQPPFRLELAGDPGPNKFAWSDFKSDQGLDFRSDPASTSVVEPAVERINQLAVDAELTPGEPLQLNQAHALRRSAAEAGIPVSVLPHPSGRGYDVAPTARLNPAARAAMPQDERAAQLPYDQSATGRLAPAPDGSMRAEIRPEAVARGSGAAAQRQQVEAERQRRTELGLSNITPVAPVTEAGNPALRQVSFDNAPTGRMVVGADGVRQERRAEVVNRANQPAPAPHTVTSASGAPFATRQTAQHELQRQQMGSSHQVVPAGGDESLGFVLKEKGRASAQLRGNPTFDGQAERSPNWRTNAMQANRVARGLGIESRGKRLAQVVAEIDVAEALTEQESGNPNGSLDAATAVRRTAAAATTVPTTQNAPKLVAEDADESSASSASSASATSVKDGLLPVRPPRAGPRTAAQSNLAASLEITDAKATESGADPTAAGPRQPPAAAPRPTTSRNDDFQPASVGTVRTAVRDLVNGIGVLPNQLGRVVVATSAEIRNDWQPLIGPVTMESEEAGQAQGFYDEKTKTVFLIADNIRAGDEIAVAAHELMHKHGQAVLGEQGWNQLHDAIGAWANAPVGSTERAVHDEAARRVRASGQELANQELFPYAVQVALEMGVRPNAMAPQNSVARWLAKVRSALRTAWNKVAGQKGDFNSLDLVNLAFGIAQRENPAYAQVLDGAALQAGQRAKEALRELSQKDELFALPKSDKKTIAGIAADHSPAIDVQQAELPGGETLYTLTMPDRTKARITLRKASRDAVYGVDDADGGTTWITARPGENPPARGTKDDVWLDVSLLKPGQMGGQVYNIAATFAHNTGRIFIGDPSGLSDVAMRRRAEQMLASALKLGTTEHLAPHPRQVNGDASIGVPPLRWVYGDHIGNVERLIDASLQALENESSGPQTLTYDLETGTFSDPSGTQRSDPAGVLGSRVDGRNDTGADSGAAGSHPNRRRTAARRAVFRALLGQGSGVRQVSGNRNGILAGLVSQSDQLSSPSPRDRIFYSRRGVTPPETGPQSAAQRIGAAIQGTTITNLKQQAGFKAADYRGIGLQFLGRRQLVDVYGGMVPELRQYSDLMARMDADKNEAGAGADQLATDWSKLPDERALAELMHDSTLAQIDPTKEFGERHNKTDWTRLRAKYQALTPGAKDVYARARDTYRQHMRDVRSAIKERIERTEISSDRKAAMLKRMDDEFFGHIKGVYFPLARFGQYVVVVKDAEGKVANVSRAETMAEADQARSQLLSVFPAGKGFSVGKVLKAKDFVAERDSVGRGFMEQLYGVLDKQGMDSKQRTELEDALGQLYLSSLPDLSWAKHGIHRKGTPGFSQDARRAFAQNVFHGASYLAKLRYGDRLQDELGEMQRRVDAGSTDSSFDSVKAQQVVDEMVKRHDAAMNPKSNAVSTALTSLGFMFHLGLSPASAMVNLTQTALVAYPIMGARWGFQKSGAALLKASQEAVRGKNDITASLNADEKAAYDEAVRSGVVDVTMAHDLAGIAQGEDRSVSYKLRPVMRAASFLFHHAEKFNRQVTFVAAYRLAREAGAEQKQAYEQAVQATYDGHFDYSSNNRPRVMQGNVARVLLLFKQYGQNMVYTLVRSAQQSLKGATPEDRAQARKAFGGLLAMHGAAAGALGLPMVTTLLAAASMLGGDDDEPWDAQVALQNVLADTFGQKPAEVLAHGFSRLTPWDISGRVGLDKLIFPDVQEGLEGQRLAESAMTAALGPVAGIGINVLKGVQEISEGRYQRGLETMAPSVLRGPLKALRYGEEGVRDKSGIVVQDEVDAAALLGQAAGFSPSSVRNSYEGKSAIVGHDRALQARRSALVEQFAIASMAKDEEGKLAAREDIAKFNEKNPNRRIQPMQLAQSVRIREKRIREAQDGVYLPGKRRDATEQGRFAVSD